MAKQKKTIEELVEMGLPTSEQFETELKRLRGKQSFAKAMWSTISSLIVVAAIAVIISTVLLPVLRVTGSSMSPTLQNDQLILCVKSSSLKRGDIVAFYYNNKVLLKRVIGLPGETVDIGEDGTVYIDGEALDESSYLDSGSLSKGSVEIDLPVSVSEGRILLLGDNREISIDSRSSSIGLVAEDNIIGKVVFRIWPFDSIGRL